MTFWSRLRQSKLKLHLYSKEFKRCYTLNHAPVITNHHIHSRSLIPVSNNPNFVAQGSQFELFCKVRSYAAPFQANQKKEEKDSSGPRLNEQITSPSVRLVTDEGHYVLSRYEALSRAKSLKLDLVEVDRHAKPPVCKLLDYHKEKYIQQTKEKERAKSKTALKKGACKEVRFAAKIKPKDLQIKADMVKRLMERGYRVKCTAIEPTDSMDLETLLSRFSALIEDVAIEESGPKVEKKQAYVVVRHVKFGPAKKGSGKKASKADVSSQSFEGNGDTTRAASDMEHVGSEEASDEDVDRTKKSEWAVFDRDDDIGAVFDINDQASGPSKTTKHEHSAVETGPSPSPSANTASPMENRYARDPRLVKPSGVNGAHQIPAQRRQPQFSMNTNTSPQTRPPLGPVDAPARDVPRKDSSPTKGYGIFSTQQANATPNPPPESNRYKKSDPSDPARTRSATGVPPHRNPPATDSGRWGVFGSDGSTMVPNKKNESQADIQRR